MKSLVILLTVVQTLYGPIQGIERDSVMAYLGIPFAKAPVGELAFRAPQPPDPWDTVLIAQKGSRNCPQVHNKYSSDYTDPDCLYLNIFVPTERPSYGLQDRFAERPQAEPAERPASPERRPVVVWFHGGAFTTGGAGINSKGEGLKYELGLFARETNTIVVSCNYRLNVYGFLNLHDFNDRFDSNIGIRDQLQALRFVREVISAFGGDTANIVLMGQSAGAASVINLMALKEAQPLFHKAIAFSPCVDHFLSAKDSHKRTKKYLSYLGVSEHRTDRLLAMTPNQLEKAAGHFYHAMVVTGDVRCPFSPWLDNDLYTDYPFLTARECTKPLMIGYTSEESRMFTNGVPHGLFHLLGTVATNYAKRNGLREFKVEKKDTAYWVRFNEALTDYMFHAPIDTFVAHYKGSVQTYEYTYIPIEGQHLGCYHWSDIPVLFGMDYKTAPQSNPLTRQKGAEMREQVKRFIYSESDRF